MKGAEPLPPSPEMIGLYLADLASGSDRSPALSVSTIERRVSGLAWQYAQREFTLDRKNRHIAAVLAGIRRRHARPPVQKEAILPDDILAMTATCRMICADSGTARSCFWGLPGACAVRKSSAWIARKTTRRTLAVGSRSSKKAPCSRSMQKPVGERSRSGADRKTQPAPSTRWSNGGTSQESISGRSSYGRRVMGDGRWRCGFRTSM